MLAARAVTQLAPYIRNYVFRTHGHRVEPPSPIVVPPLVTFQYNPIYRNITRKTCMEETPQKRAASPGSAESTAKQRRQASQGTAETPKETGLEGDAEEEEEEEAAEEAAEEEPPGSHMGGWYGRRRWVWDE